MKKRSVLWHSVFLVLGLFGYKPVDETPSTFRRPVNESGLGHGIDVSAVNGLSQFERFGPELRWSKKPVHAAEYWSAMKRLSRLEQQGVVQWAESKSASSVLKYAKKQLQTVPPENDVFFSVAIEENKELLENEIGSVIDELVKTQSKLSSQWQGTEYFKTHFNSAVSIEDINPKMKGFLNALPREFQSMGLDKDISQIIITELAGRVLPILDALSPVLAELQPNQILKKNLSVVRKALPILVNEAPETVARIERDLLRGDDVVKKIEAADGSHDVLRLIMDFWHQMSPEEREEVFKSQSPTLYSYLNAMSEEGFECLKRTICNPIPPKPDVILAITTKRFILARIQVEGFQGILRKINLSAGNYVVEAINKQLLAELPSGLDHLRDIIVMGVRKKQQDIEALRANDWSGLRAKLSDYMSKRVLGQQPLLTWPDLLVQPTGQEVGPSGSAHESGIGAVASFIGALSTTWPQAGDKQMRRDMVSIINWSLYLSGISRWSDTEALPQPYFGSFDPTYRLDNYFDRSDWVYGVPSIFGKSKIGAYVPPTKKLFRAEDQWLLVENLMEMSRNLVDWETTRFDKAFSIFNLRDFMPDVEGDAGEKKLFPKEQIYLLTLGLAGQVLDNALRDPSHFVLVDLDGKDRLLADGQYDNVVMAYTKNYEDGTGSEIDVVGAAQAILAIESFKRATLDIRKTKIPFLTSNAEKPSIVKRIEKAHVDLTDLQRALAVFLSRYGVGEDGQVCKTLNRQWECLAPETSPSGVIAVVRALDQSYQLTSVELFNDRAQEALSAFIDTLAVDELGLWSSLGGDRDMQVSFLVEGLDLLVNGRQLFEENASYHKLKAAFIKALQMLH